MSSNPSPGGRGERVIVFDTTLRDGEQAAGVCFSPADKVEIARALETLRVDVIEAGFPQASPLEARAVEAVARTVRDAEVCALARVPELGDRVVSFHGQDDLGLATANTLAAVRAGARQVEVAVNGIGERAGNTSLEEVVMALTVHGPELGVFTRADTTAIYAASRLVEERSGLVVPANKAIVGRNAFRHASGIHQDGVLKKRETYEVLDPAAIGHPEGSQIVLGKLSGRRGFAERLSALGIALEPDELDRAFARFQAVAETGVAMSDAALVALARAGEAGDAAPTATREAWPGPGV